MRLKHVVSKCAAATALCFATVLTLVASQFEVLHTFSDPFENNEENGSHPFAGLTQGSDGYLYGTVINDSDYEMPSRVGWAYRISLGGSYESLADRGMLVGPLSGLVQANDGYLYGVALQDPNGVVYRLGSSGSLEYVHDFYTGNISDPYTPMGTLVQGSDGFLYGTSRGGGLNFYGTVFKVSTSGARTVIRHFTEGGEPVGGLVEGAPGVFYGICNAGVYKITSNGVFSIVFNAPFPTSGNYSSPVKGSDGNIYVAFAERFVRITPSGSTTVLHTFTQAEGEVLNGGITEGDPGVFYGVAAHGGTHDWGTIYKVTASGSFQVLYNFTGGSDGGRPCGKLLAATNGYIYGTTFAGSSTGSAPSGTIFRFSDAPSAPLISISPQSQTRTIGEAVTFSVFASGANPLSYQWQKNGTNLIDTAQISGTQVSALTITNLVRADAGNYRVIVTNSLGAVTSAVANLTIWDYVKVTVSTNSANAGSQVTFIANTSATAVNSYQWRKNGTLLVDGPSVSGATTAVLTLSDVLREDAGSYQVRLGIPVAPSVLNSAPVTLAVQDPFITIPPASVTNSAGTTATLSVTVAGTTPLTYKWYKRVNTNSFLLLNDGDPKYSGVTTPTLQIHDLDQSDVGSYVAVVTNLFSGAFGVWSPEATVTVVTPPTIVAGPLSQTVPVGSNVILSVTALNVETYQWRKGIDILPGETNSTLVLNNIQPANSGVYTVTVSNEHGTTSASATINVAANPPTITTAPTNTFSLPGKSVTLSVVATDATSFQWFKDGTLLEGRTSATLSISSAQPEDSGSYTVVVSNGGGSVNATAYLLVGRAGTFNGLFHRASEVSHDSSGLILITTRTNGSYSGKILVDGNSFSVSGKLAPDGSAVKTISRGLYAKPDLSLALQITNKATRITGTVSCSNWTAQVLADLAPYSKTNITTNFGKFTMVIPGSTNATLAPAGYSISTVTVSTNGRVAQSPYFADGVRPVVQAALLSADGTWPLYMQAYPKMVAKTNGVLVKEYQGSLIGWVTLTNDALAGFVSWNRRGIDSALYPNGFTNETALLGSRYVYNKGQRLLDMPTGTATLAEGNLSAPLLASFILKTNNLVTVQPNSHGLRFSFSTTVGMLSGTFTNPVNNVRTTLRGVVLQNQNVAAGYFLGTNQGGLFLLEGN